MNKEFLQKIVKSIAYASAGGSIVIGGGLIDLVDVDLFTTAYMVVAAVLFNAAREYIKKLTADGK